MHYFFWPDQPLVACCEATKLDRLLGPWLPHVGGLSGCWNTSMEPDKKLSARLAGIYYNHRGYWKRLTAIKKLASVAKVTEQQAKDWPKKQAIWQIYLPAPRHIPRPKFDVAVPNKVNQADLLFLPHSRYNEAESLTSKTATEVADGLPRIYKRSPLRWPKLLQVDPGREFMGSVSQLLAKHSIQVRRGRADIHRDQGIVERLNRTLVERLFGHQYAQEMRLPSGERSTELVKRFPSVVATLTRINGKKHSDAIKAKTLTQKPSSVFPGRPLGLKEQNLTSGVGVRYLYQPGELEGGRRRATEPVWTLEVYRLGRSVTKSRKENPQKLTQLSSRSHPRHLVGKKDSTKRHLHWCAIFPIMELQQKKSTSMPVPKFNLFHYSSLVLSPTILCDILTLSLLLGN